MPVVYMDGNFGFLLLWKFCTVDHLSGLTWGILPVDHLGADLGDLTRGSSRG